MIIQEQTPLWKRLALPAAILAAAAVAYMYWPGSQPADKGAAQAASAAAGGLTGGMATPFGDAAPAAATVGTDGRPSDVSSEDWAALSAVLAKQKGEAERIVSYLRYQHDFEFWQSTIDSKNVEKRHQMAQSLLEQLPERVAKGEFTGAEGTLMGTVLLGDLEPDEAKREKKIEEWTQKLGMAAPQPSDEKLLTDRDRLTELKRRQANAYAEWQVKPPGDRDQAQLDKAMQEAQRWYASGAP
jgi:hypothetical protein